MITLISLNSFLPKICTEWRSSIANKSLVHVSVNYRVLHIYSAVLQQPTQFLYLFRREKCVFVYIIRIKNMNIFNKIGYIATKLQCLIANLLPRCKLWKCPGMCFFGKLTSTCKLGVGFRHEFMCFPARFLTNFFCLGCLFQLQHFSSCALDNGHCLIGLMHRFPTFCEAGTPFSKTKWLWHPLVLKKPRNHFLKIWFCSIFIFKWLIVIHTDNASENTQSYCFYPTTHWKQTQWLRLLLLKLSAHTLAHKYSEPRKPFEGFKRLRY